MTRRPARDPGWERSTSAGRPRRLGQNEACYGCAQNQGGAMGARLVIIAVTELQVELSRASARRGSRNPNGGRAVFRTPQSWLLIVALSLPAILPGNRAE